MQKKNSMLVLKRNNYDLRKEVESKFEMSRIAFREHAYKGQIPGVKKSSW